MRILCFGDSLPLPRNGCCYSDTWIAQLKSLLPNIDFICDFKGGLLVRDLYHSWNQYYKYIKADVIIIQEGICDCAPRYIKDNRLFWEFIISLCSKTKTIDLFWKLVKLGSRKPSCTYTTKDAFKKFYDDMFNDMFKEGVKHVIVIKIGHGAPSVLKKSEYYNTNVDEYNDIFDILKEKYDERIVLIDPLNHVEEDLFVDGYHCNAKGMDIVFKDLSDTLIPIIDQIK